MVAESQTKLNRRRLKS